MPIPNTTNGCATTPAGAIAVPLYLEDPSNGPASLLKKAATIGTGGWWLGGTHMIPNESFLAQVQAQVPKDARVVVACQKGLRSLSAAEQLSRAGYRSLAWINGGLDTARPGDLPTANGRDVRCESTNSWDASGAGAALQVPNPARKYCPCTIY